MDELIFGRPGTPIARIQGSIVDINGDLHKRRRRPVMPAKVSTTLRANVMRPAHGLRARLHPARKRRLTPAPIRGDIHRLVQA